jgi:cytochrome c-type biogenesis protein CcmF
LRALLPPAVGAILLGVIGIAAGIRNPWTLLTLAFGGYTAQVTFKELLLPLRQRMKVQGEGLGRALLEANVRRGRRRTGAYVVHTGAAIVIIAIAVSSTMGVSKELELRIGESASIGDYTLTFLRADSISEPHRQSLVAEVAVSRRGRDLGVMSPRMNQYERQREPIGTPDVHSSLTEDLYLSILNIDAQSGTLALHALVNPMVAWIWMATGLMALGGLVALAPRRRVDPVVVPTPSVATATSLSTAAPRG